MKLRTGRHRDQNIYIQLGEEPCDDDEFLAHACDPARAKLLVDIANGDSPAFGHDGIRCHTDCLGSKQASHAPSADEVAR